MRQSGSGGIKARHGQPLEPWNGRYSDSVKELNIPDDFVFKAAHDNFSSDVYVRLYHYPGSTAVIIRNDLHPEAGITVQVRFERSRSVRAHAEADDPCGTQRFH